MLTRDVPLDESALLTGLSDGSQRELRQITHPARREEFLRARFLVRFVTGLAVDPPRDGDGIIRWPDRTTGSLSHSLGDIVVVTASSQDCMSVGVDMERPSRIKSHLESKICTARDSELVASGILTVAQVFAAKESLFKCHYPLGRRRFWFLDAEVADVSPAPQGVVVSLRVLVDSSPSTPAGSLTSGLILPSLIEDTVMAVVSIPASKLHP